jgi:PAS domain S-box-containing protein
MVQTPSATPSQPEPTPEEARAQSEALFNSIGDGAVAADEYGKITRINPTALRILGFTESEMLGKWFMRKLVAVDENNVPTSPIDRPITRAFLTGKPITEKMFYRKKNGQMVPVSTTVSPIIHNNKPIGAIEVFRDITLENEIDRMKSEFISLASHQLRTPLSAIKTYSHMLSDGYMGDIAPAQRTALRTIINATNRMNELISTLLNITRIESGTIAISSKMISLDKLVQDVVKDLEVQAGDKNITITIKQPKKPIRIRTDNLIAKEILANLVANSIKYTPDGGTIQIRTQRHKGTVVIAVQDNGVGIPKYSQDQVFTKFFRAPNVIKYETTGTGLGLYLVKGLTERLGGKIWFESEEGKGSTFFFSPPSSKKATTKLVQPT